MHNTRRNDIANFPFHGSASRVLNTFVLLLSVIIYLMSVVEDCASIQSSASTDALAFFLMEIVLYIYSLDARFIVI